MSVKPNDLVIYGSASMPDDDTPTGIGGAISSGASLIRCMFNDITPDGNIQIVSSNAGDTTQTITAYGRDAAGVLINEVKTLNGLTAVPMTVATVWERLLKAIKSATCAGDVAVESVTAVDTGTAAGGAAETASEMAYITLDGGASGSDDTYNSQVLRITGGTGAGQIRYIVDYRGSDKRAWVNLDWATPPDGTSVFRISQGMVLEKSPAEVYQVRRIFYNAQADAGSAKTYYEKIFYKNNHATLTLTLAQIIEQADPSGKVTFALESSLGGSDTNGAGNRQTHTGGYTFNSTTKNVANSQNHTAGAAQGIWMLLSLGAGDAAAKSTVTMRESGSST